MPKIPPLDQGFEKQLGGRGHVGAQASNGPANLVAGGRSCPARHVWKGGRWAKRAMFSRVAFMTLKSSSAFVFPPYSPHVWPVGEKV